MHQIKINNMKFSKGMVEAKVEANKQPFQVGVR